MPWLILSICIAVFVVAGASTGATPTGDGMAAHDPAMQDTPGPMTACADCHIGDPLCAQSCATCHPLTTTPRALAVAPVAFARPHGPGHGLRCISALIEVPNPPPRVT
jgi:hypothetical protein